MTNANRGIIKALTVIRLKLMIKNALVSDKTTSCVIAVATKSIKVNNAIISNNQKNLFLPKKKVYLIPFHPVKSEATAT